MAGSGHAAGVAGGITAPAPKRTSYRWLVLAIIFCCYVIQYADRANIAVLIPALRQEFTMTNLEAGLLMSLFFLGYVLTQIPSSFLYKRSGNRVVVPLSIIGFSAFTFSLGRVSAAGPMKWLRLGLGLAEGPSPIGVTTTINNWFPPKEKATAVGLGFVCPTMVAPILVPIIATWLMVHFGWRSVFFWFSIPGFVLAVLWYILVRTKPEECAFCSEAEVDYIRDTEDVAAHKGTRENPALRRFDGLLRVTKLKLLGSSREVFASKNVWGISLGYMLLIMANNGMLTWIPSYLVREKHYSFMRMGFMAALPWIGGFIGSSFGGWLSDRVFEKRRKPTMLVTTIMTAVLMMVLIHMPGNVTLMGVTLFTIGFFLHFGYPGFMSYTMAISEKRAYPMTSALVNSVGNLGGFFSPIIAGLILDIFKVYSAAFAFFGIAALLSFACIFMLEEPRLE